MGNVSGPRKDTRGGAKLDEVLQGTFMLFMLDRCHDRPSLIFVYNVWKIRSIRTPGKPKRLLTSDKASTRSDREVGSRDDEGRATEAAARGG